MSKTNKKTGSDEATTSSKTVLRGVVRKKSGDKTVSVTVERFIKHPVYQKYYSSSKNYAAHDEDNAAEVGDKVEITETRPLSKNKHFIVTNIIKATDKVS